MEHHNIDPGIAYYNKVLFVLAAFFKIFAALTLSEALSYLFQILSIVSVTLVIIINWNKAMDVIFKRKK